MSALIKAAEKTVAVKTKRKIRDQDIEYALEKNVSNIFTVDRHIPSYSHLRPEIGEKFIRD